jgi:putative endonuclease
MYPGRAGVAEWQTCLPAGRRSGLKIMYTVYVLQSLRDQSLYKGLTDNLVRRVSQHQHGHVLGTRNKLPLMIVYTAVFPTRPEARAHEKYLKSGVGRQFLMTVVHR